MLLIAISLALSLTTMLSVIVLCLLVMAKSISHLVSLIVTSSCSSPVCDLLNHDVVMLQFLDVYIVSIQHMRIPSHSIHIEKDHGTAMRP